MKINKSTQDSTTWNFVSAIKLSFESLFVYFFSSKISFFLFHTYTLKFVKSCDKLLETFRFKFFTAFQVCFMILCRWSCRWWGLFCFKIEYSILKIKIKVKNVEKIFLFITTTYDKNGRKIKALTLFLAGRINFLLSHKFFPEINLEKRKSFML